MSEQAAYTEHVYQEYSCGSYVDPLHQREEIVRCKDCARWRDACEWNRFFNDLDLDEPLGFCAWGERREQ